MKIVHQYKNIEIQKKVDEDADLLLGNDRGNYFYLTADAESKYQGFFYADGSNYKNDLIVYKTVDCLSIFESGKITEVKNSFFEVERKYKNGLSEKYFLPNGYNSLCVRTNRKVGAELILDMRYPYDCRQMGRFYSVEAKEDYALIKFVKRRDWSEDAVGDKKEFTLYLAVKTDKSSYGKVEKFFPKYYRKDHQRNSYPWDRFVYKALEMEFEKAVLSVGKSPNEVIEEVNKVFNNFEKLRRMEEENVYRKFEPLAIGDDEIKMAHLCAQNSVYTMMVENNGKKGVYAGLPWFFQFWNIDEAVSMLQIYRINKSLAREVILSQLDMVLDNGQILTKRFCEMEDVDLQSASAFGWLADRILRILSKYELPNDFKMDIIERFEKIVSRLLHKRTKDDLAINLPQETWMDSLERSGARIEIQALRLRIYDLLYELTHNDQYEILKRELKSKIRQKFHKEGILMDSPEDRTIRPNVFLAAYLYPELLSREEWEVCFDRVLPRIYLEWGGISSVDKSSSEFVGEDTGENSASYHNGNSWYWINNLVALVLYRTNPRKYSQFIGSIMEASMNEILYSGIIGHHAEVSSAVRQTSSGCGAQLWSAAMYIEMFDEILKN